MARTKNTKREQSSETEPIVEDSKPATFKVREKGTSVRIRAGAGTNFAHVDGKYLGKGVFVIDEVKKGEGSKTGWGHLAGRDGWVALDFVEIVK